MTNLEMKIRPADRPGAGRSLAEEHALLLRDVHRRAASVLALVATHVWPEAEVQTLTGFLRGAVLRQISDEEALLYPHRPDPPFAQLAADHAQLHELTGRLERAHRTSCTLPALGELVSRLLRVLERHLPTEQAVLAVRPEPAGGVPATPAGRAGARTDVEALFGPN